MVATIWAMDAIRAGRSLRALRHRRRLRQSDVAEAVGLSQSQISDAERGQLARMKLDDVERIAQFLEADLVVTVRWRAGDVDRLLDERHASLVERIARLLEDAGWETKPEVSYSEYGERGSIDLVAWHAPSRTLLIIEVKTELVSVEETLRRQDAKVRLAAGIVRERFGWQPKAVSKMLVMPEDRTCRRRVERHSTLFGRVYPLRGHATKAWIRGPVGAVGALLFLPEIGRGGGRPGSARIRRVRRPKADAVVSGSEAIDPERHDVRAQPTPTTAAGDGRKQIGAARDL